MNPYCGLGRAPTGREVYESPRENSPNLSHEMSRRAVESSPISLVLFDEIKFKLCAVYARATPCNLYGRATRRSGDDEKKRMWREGGGGESTAATKNGNAICVRYRCA